MGAPPDQLIDLSVAIAETRARLEKQLQACKSGSFQLFWAKDGKRVDATPDHIAELHRQIAEYDRLITHFGSSNATRP